MIIETSGQTGERGEPNLVLSDEDLGLSKDSNWEVGNLVLSTWPSVLTWPRREDAGPKD